MNLRVRFPQLQHFNWVTFCPRGIQLFIEKDNTWAGETISDANPSLIRAARCGHFTRTFEPDPKKAIYPEITFFLVTGCERLSGLIREKGCVVESIHVPWKTGPFPPVSVILQIKSSTHVHN